MLWGAATVLFPDWLFRIVGMAPPYPLPLWQVVGMFVLVYGLGYWWAGRYPDRHAHLVFLGLIGKVAGPIGFATAVMAGALPIGFGWTIVANDLVWWPAFALYVRDAARLSGGWMAFLSGSGIGLRDRELVPAVKHVPDEAGDHTPHGSG